MAVAPSYTGTPVVWAGLVPATADVSFTAPSNVTILGSAGASGTKINQIDVIPVGTVVAGLVCVFAYDGTSYHLLAPPFTIAAATVNTTTAPVVQTATFDNLVLPTGWSLRVTTTVAGNVSLVEVAAYGSSF